jgi:hypothetical protein
MDAIWLDVLTNAGPMVLFVTWLLWRDGQRDRHQETVTAELIANNTNALNRIADALERNADHASRQQRDTT